jgi:hypothetical protein
MDQYLLHCERRITHDKVLAKKASGRHGMPSPVECVQRDININTHKIANTVASFINDSPNAKAMLRMCQVQCGSHARLSALTLDDKFMRLATMTKFSSMLMSLSPSTSHAVPCHPQFVVTWQRSSMVREVCHNALCRHSMHMHQYGCLLIDGDDPEVLTTNAACVFDGYASRV